MSQSDHNTIITKFSIKWESKTKSQESNLFNLKNIAGQTKFTELTSKPGIMSNIFKGENVDIERATKKFIKKLNGCMHQCFQKVRVKKKENKELDKLFNKRRVLRTKTDEDSKNELIKVDKELADKCARDNYIKIKDEIKGMDCEEGGMNVGKLWQLKKKLSPRGHDPPTAMMDSKGNLVTSTAGIEKLATEHFQKVLENRKMKDEPKHIQIDKEELAKHRLDLARDKKSPPWTMEDLETVLKFLKNNKCRDPIGNINEIFKNNVAGGDLKVAILLLMNHIKNKHEYPELIRLCNITSIYKKGKRSDFNNYRGIFRVVIFRSILDRLIYNDIYPIIDSNLSDANVGSRKGRNVRDNLFVLCAIMNSVKSGNEEPCDLGVYDVIKCFDALWNQECINDLWDAGCQNDKLHLLSLGNQRARVAIKTPEGITKRFDISNVIMQGTVNSGLFCTCSMDKLAKLVYGNKSLIYKYKGVADVPPLEMVDDVLTITKCSITSVAMNATVNAFIENKKLQLSQP